MNESMVAGQLNFDPTTKVTFGNTPEARESQALAAAKGQSNAAVIQAGLAAQSLLTNPVSTIAGLGGGYMGEKVGGKYFGDDGRLVGGFFGGVMGGGFTSPTTALLRNKYLGYTLASDINRGVKNFDNTVGESYFHAPDKTYRVTETPEVGTIIETGKNFPNVATNANSSNNMRYIRAIHSYNTSHASQGLKLINTKDQGLTLVKISPDQKTIGLRPKAGSAHGGLSQASLGQIWTGSLAKSGNFPNGVLEINTPTIVRAAYDRTRGNALTRSDFELGPSEGLPIGTRIGFDTGEMPT